MPTYWDAFCQEYGDRVKEFSLNRILEIFWHYCHPKGDYTETPQLMDKMIKESQP